MTAWSAALARYHELHQAARVARPPELGAPATAAATQRQLLLLRGFSAVRWVRNQPLVPVPVVVAFERTVNSAAQSLGRPVVYTPADIAATLAPEEPVAAAPAHPAKAARTVSRAARPAASKPATQPIAPISARAPAAVPDSPTR